MAVLGHGALFDSQYNYIPIDIYYILIELPKIH